MSTHIYLCASFATVAPLILGEADKPYRGKTFAFIPTASTPEKVRFYVNSGRKALEKAGLVLDSLDLEHLDPQEAKTRLQACDGIYVSGGNTFYLVQELRRTGIDEVIRRMIAQGKPYIGESAGAMVLAPDLAYAAAMDDPSKAPGLGEPKGLDILDFYPLPHYTNPPFARIAHKIMDTYGASLDLEPMSNHQVVVVQDGLRKRRE